MQKHLDELTQRMQKAFGQRLVSVILYGSAAAGEYNGDFSDLNILCVLTQVTSAELKDAEPIFHWWRGLKNPAPLLLSETEVRTSTDCFPIEFHDMKERRRVLTGADVIESLEIDDSFYRAQIEYQLRAKALRLRQRAGGLMHDPELLCIMLVESLSTFVMLFRHALRISGYTCPATREGVILESERVFGIDPKPCLTLLAIREHRLKPKSLDGTMILEGYLAQINRVVDAVDVIAK
jgi:predicted nucleotidyltransferase